MPQTGLGYALFVGGGRPIRSAAVCMCVCVCVLGTMVLEANHFSQLKHKQNTRGAAAAAVGKHNNIRRASLTPHIVYPLMWGQISRGPCAKPRADGECGKNSWPPCHFQRSPTSEWRAHSPSVKSRSQADTREFTPIHFLFTWRAQEVAFQGGAEAGGVVLQVAHGEGLRGGVLIVDRPGLTPDTGTAVPGHVGHGETVLRGRTQTHKETKPVRKRKSASGTFMKMNDDRLKNC